MKKNWLLSLSLVLVLVLALAACAPAEKTDEKKDEGTTTAEDKKDETKTDESASTGGINAEISVQVETGWMPYYQKAVDKVRETNPNAKINLIEIGAFDHLEILDNTDATNPDFADVFAFPADRFVQLSDKEVLASLDAKAMAAELGGFDNYDAGLGGNLNKNGDYLGFPFNIETLIVFVNKANAETNGIDYTKPAELQSVSKATTVLLPIFDAWFGVAPLNSANIELLKKDGDKLSTDLAAPYADLASEKKTVIEAIYKYWKLNVDENTPLFDNEAGWGYIDDQFRTGGMGVYRLGGPWETKSNTELAGIENLEVFPINHITVAGMPLKHWQGGWGLGINSRIEGDADKMALATALIKEIVNPANAVELYKTTGKIMENVPASVYAESDLAHIDKKVISNVIESYKLSPPRPIFKEYGHVWDTWKNAVLSWNSVKPASVEDAYNELKASFEAMMGNF